MLILICVQQITMQNWLIEVKCCATAVGGRVRLELFLTRSTVLGTRYRWRWVKAFVRVSYLNLASNLATCNRLVECKMRSCLLIVQIIREFRRNFSNTLLKLEAQDCANKLINLMLLIID